MSSPAFGPGASAPGLELSMVDTLWEGGPRYRQAAGVFPLSSDSAWLGEFLHLSGVKTVCDLGCGGGTLLLQVLGRRPTVKVCGIDILPEAVAAAEENLRLNGCEGRLICDDLRNSRNHFPGGFDLVVSNPPYFPSNSTSADGLRGRARRESCTPLELCKAAAGLLRQGGRFSLVYPPTRLSELIYALVTAGLEPKRLRLVMKNPNTPPCAALIEAISAAKPGLNILPPLCTEGAEETIHGR